MSAKGRIDLMVFFAVLLIVTAVIVTRHSAPVKAESRHANAAVENATTKIQQGEQVFRFDTFGDEAFWGDTLKLHQAIEGAKFGGVGPGVSPAAALGAGLKVDAAALPASLIDGILHGTVDLNDPANTIALLTLNAVIGVVPMGSTASG